jgi:glycosyltransferase involved in cell wall biosynthesis
MTRGSHMRRLKLALFSPVNPRRCGVSDYTEELLPELGKLADVDLIIESYRPSNPDIASAFRTLTVQEFEANAASYDSCIYQVANSFDYHGYVVPMLARYPGIVVLHDFSLQYLMLGVSLMQGDLKALEAFLQPGYGAGATRLARQLLFSRMDPYEISLVRPILEWATGIVVHSECVRAKVLEECPELASSVRFMYMGVPVTDTPPTAAGLKTRYGFQESDFILASVSTVSYTKRLDLALQAVARLKQRHAGLKFVILGGGTLGAKVRGLIDRYGLRNTVVHTGWVTAEQYRDYIQLTDAVVDLRYPAGTEASASLSRAIAAGKPVIVSAHGWFLDLPDAFALKVPVNAAEVDAIESGVEDLMLHPAKRAGMRQAAWEFARTNLRIASCAKAYVDFIGEMVARPARASVPAALLGNQPKMQRLLVASVYKSFRVMHLAKAYGFSDAVRRVRQQLTRKIASEGGS